MWHRSLNSPNWPANLIYICVYIQNCKYNQKIWHVKIWFNIFYCKILKYRESVWWLIKYRKVIASSRRNHLKQLTINFHAIKLLIFDCNTNIIQLFNITKFIWYWCASHKQILYYKNISKIIRRYVTQMMNQNWIIFDFQIKKLFCVTSVWYK